MRKFIITSPAYSGEAEVLYDEYGKLVVIDLMRTDMNENLVSRFLDKLPTNVDGLEKAFEGTKVLIVEHDYEISFDMFWNKYKRKINPDRCKPLWERLSKSDKMQAWLKIDEYEKYITGTGFRRKADPQKYLTDKYWKTDWKNAD